MLSMTKQMKRENGETTSVVKAQITTCANVNCAEGTVLPTFTTVLDSLKLEKLCVSSFCS